MINNTVEALKREGYDLGAIKVLIRVEMPPGYRAMTLEDGAVLGEPAFSSQAMLNHVLEEEVLHLRQKVVGKAREFGPGTAKALEDEIHEARRFHLPEV